MGYKEFIENYARIEKQRDKKNLHRDYIDLIESLKTRTMPDYVKISRNVLVGQPPLWAGCKKLPETLTDAWGWEISEECIRTPTAKTKEEAEVEEFDFFLLSKQEHDDAIKMLHHLYDLDINGAVNTPKIACYWPLGFKQK